MSKYLLQASLGLENSCASDLGFFPGAEQMVLNPKPVCCDPAWVSMRKKALRDFFGLP